MTLVSVVVILFYSNQSAIKNEAGWGAMKYQQLIYGMLAIFIYVGVEVTIDNNFGALLKTPGYITELGLDESKISKYISLYWGSMMIGRWTGAVSVFNFKGNMKKLMMVVVPFIAFAIVLGVSKIYGNDTSDLYGYAIWIVIALAVFFYGQEKPVKTLVAVSVFAGIAMLIGIFTTGITSVYAFMAGGLACSVMWPCIFSLAIAGLGKYTSQASAFLIMMIVGGAVIPPMQGYLSDKTSIHSSYIIPVCCFAFLAWYAFKVKTILKIEGIDYDAAPETAH